MAKASCKLCGAGFEGPDAASAAGEHAVSFHPGTDAAKAATGKGGKAAAATTDDGETPEVTSTEPGAAPDAAKADTKDETPAG